MNHAVLALLLLVSSSGCSRSTTLVPKRGPDGGGRDAAGAFDAAPADAKVAEAGRDATPGVFTVDAGIVYCGASPCVCANGLDDDGDGLIDGFDPECTGPFDGDEATFATGLPGTRRTGKCEDCFFDDNAGSGDDDCRHPSSCSFDGTPQSGGGSCGACAPSPTCVNSCLPRTPSGCDCFGCCEVRTGTSVVNVLLEDTCSLDTIADVTKCPRCLPEPSCKNECGECELCPGKTIEMLAARCGSSPEGYSCDTGDVCGPQRPCPQLSYCQLGCCIPIVI